MRIAIGIVIAPCHRICTERIVIINLGAHIENPIVIAAATETPRGERSHAVRGAENAIVRLGRLGLRHMAHVVIMIHGTRLLNAAHYADEYLILQIKGTIG
jgi:hypothetical protein